MVNEFPYHENIFSGPYIMLLCILLLHETVDRSGHDIVHARIKLHRYNRNIVVRKEVPICTVKVEYCRLAGAGLKPDYWVAALYRNMPIGNEIEV